MTHQAIGDQATDNIILLSESFKFGLTPSSPNVHLWLQTYTRTVPVWPLLCRCCCQAPSSRLQHRSLRFEVISRIRIRLVLVARNSESPCSSPELQSYVFSGRGHRSDSQEAQTPTCLRLLQKQER